MSGELHGIFFLIHCNTCTIVMKSKNNRQMKQPTLGKRIQELRKSQGITQEELVDLCNVSVRTIQRIEAGEVTPRSHTIKTILHALGEELSSIQEPIDEISHLDKKTIYTILN